MIAKHLCMGCMGEKKDDLCPSCGWLEGSTALSADQLSPRSVLLDRYLLGKALGQGVFGITYLAWDLADERKIAIKEYFPRNVVGRASDRFTVTSTKPERSLAFHSGLRKYADEAKNLKSLGNRPGLVTVLRTFDTNGTCYMAMDFLIGKTLSRQVEEAPQGRLYFHNVLAILVPPMEALSELHRYGLFHLDINPNHVNVTGSVGKLLDFGGAKRATRLVPGMTTMVPILDWGYLALEQLGNTKPQGAFTDIYALAATFYFCLTGLVPLSPMDRKEHDDLRLPSDLGVGLPARSEKAIMRALSLNPENRHDSIDDFRRDIDPEEKGSKGWPVSPATVIMEIQGQIFQIFLCHSSRDKPAVRRLYWRLHHDGLDPWLDEEQLLPGQEWELEIKKAVRAANLVIVCLSRESVDERGYVHKEIKLALDTADEQPPNTIYLIPARLDDVEVPERLCKWQWVDLFEERGYQRLMRAINEVKASRS